MSDPESGGPGHEPPYAGPGGDDASTLAGGCFLVEITDRLVLLVREHYGRGPAQSQDLRP